MFCSGWYWSTITSASCLVSNAQQPLPKPTMVRTTMCCHHVTMSYIKHSEWLVCGISCFLCLAENEYLIELYLLSFNTLRPRQNGRYFADNMFKCIFSNENVWKPIEISPKFVTKGSMNNDPALFQIMAWRRPGDKPLSETMMFSSLTHICVIRPQWVNI